MPGIPSPGRQMEVATSRCRDARFASASSACRGSWSPAAASTPSCQGCAPSAGCRNSEALPDRRRCGMPDVVVLGAGPAGVVAALRAAELGATTALVTQGAFGGMAAEDGPVPVRTLAHAARLIREGRQLGLYGIEVGRPVLHYPSLLARVRQVCTDVKAHSALRPQIDALGVAVYEQAGPARFADPHTIVSDRGLRLSAEKIIIC